MDIREYKNIYEHEQTHFFYKANHEIILSLTEHYLPKKMLRILDAGCGTGLLSKRLEKYGEVTGLDMSEEAIKYAKKRRVHVIKGSVNKLPFKAESFDVVVSIDVLYHRQVDDKKAMSEIYRVLKSGGVFICRVPAHPWLLSAHDRHVQTRERYTKRILVERLSKAKFNVEKISYINLLLFLIVSVFRNIETKNTQGSGIKSMSPLFNTLLYIGIVWEKYMLRYLNIPIGNGLVAVCRK
jgi:ubiquinone/menaquinone biosynthesis C-methylase UbiE